jgi:hypothetical protein
MPPPTLCDTDAMLRFVDASPAADGRRDRRGRLLHERAVRDVGGGGAARAAACIASIHGANMVTDKPDSPHRMPPKIRCESYFACAEIDKWAPPADVEKLQAALREAGTPHRLEWYPGVEHGFVFPLRPHAYDRAAAERHWERLFSLFERTACARRPDGPSLERLGQRRRGRPAVGACPRLSRRAHRHRRAAPSASREAALQAYGPAACRQRLRSTPTLPCASIMPSARACPTGSRCAAAASAASPTASPCRPSHDEAAAALAEAKRLGAIVIPYGGGYQRRRPPACARGRPAGAQHLARAAGWRCRRSTPRI